MSVPLAESAPAPYTCRSEAMNVRSRIKGNNFIMMRLLMPNCLEWLKHGQLLCTTIWEGFATQVEVIEFRAASAAPRP